MKKDIILLTCVLATVAAGAQSRGITVSLREDLVDFSTMAVGDNEMNPYGTDYRHTFGTELSLGYHYCLTSGWEFGISVGLMLHDYSQTGIFNTWEKPTHTSLDGLFTVTEWQTYDRQTTLNLPVVLNAKYLFADWAEAQLCGGLDAHQRGVFLRDGCQQRAELARPHPRHRARVVHYAL